MTLRRAEHGTESWSWSNSAVWIWATPVFSVTCYLLTVGAAAAAMWPSVSVLHKWLTAAVQASCSGGFSPECRTLVRHYHCCRLEVRILLLWQVHRLPNVTLLLSDVYLYWSHDVALWKQSKSNGKCLHAGSHLWLADEILLMIITCVITCLFPVISSKHTRQFKADVLHQSWLRRLFLHSFDSIHFHYNTYYHFTKLLCQQVKRLLSKYLYNYDESGLKVLWSD